MGAPLAAFSSVEIHAWLFSHAGVFFFLWLVGLGLGGGGGAAGGGGGGGGGFGVAVLAGQVWAGGVLRQLLEGYDARVFGGEDGDEVGGQGVGRNERRDCAVAGKEDVAVVEGVGRHICSWSSFFLYLFLSYPAAVV